MRPYGLLRAGFPYIKTIGEFMRMHFPVDVAPARDGRLYVIGKGSMYTKGKSGPILVTNLDDDNLGSFGWKSYEYSVPDACFMWPMAIALDVDQKELYVSDSACHRISAFTTDGEYLGRWGEYGRGEGQIDRPAGLAINEEDHLYVVDSMNHRVQKFTKDGRFISSFGEFGDGPGQFNMPWGMTIDAEGSIYVADWRNDRIQKFSPNGEFIWMFGASGRGDGELYRPSGVDVDADGDIYVCDWGNNRVQLFAGDGHFVQKFVGDATLSKANLERMLTRTAKLRRMRETAPYEPEKYFARPRSVRVDEHGHMYVPDYEHYRIQIYKKEAYQMDTTEMTPPFRVPTLNYM